MSEAEQAQHRGRLAQLDLFKQRSACLSSAANLLEQGMATLRSHVGVKSLLYSYKPSITMDCDIHMSRPHPVQQWIYAGTNHTAAQKDQNQLKCFLAIVYLETVIHKRLHIMQTNLNLPLAGNGQE